MTKLDDELPLIFLSYCHADRRLAEKLYAHLRLLSDRRLCHIWFDTTGLRAGAQWPAEIREALDRAEVVLFLLTINSAKAREAGSFMWSHEFPRAIERWRNREGVEIVPVLAEDTWSLFAKYPDTSILCTFNSAPHPAASIADLAGDEWFDAVRVSVEVMFMGNRGQAPANLVNQAREDCLVELACAEAALDQAMYPMGGRTREQCMDVVAATRSIFSAPGVMKLSSLWTAARAISRLRFDCRGYDQPSTALQRLFLTIEDALQTLQRATMEEPPPFAPGMKPIERQFLPESSETAAALQDLTRMLTELNLATATMPPLAADIANTGAANIAAHAELAHSFLNEPRIDAESVHSEILEARKSSEIMHARAGLIGRAGRALIKALSPLNAAISVLVASGRRLVFAAQDRVLLPSPAKTPDAPPQPELPVKSVAELIIEAREEQGMSVRDLAEATYIRSRYIRAIEAMCREDLPARVWVVGYLKSIAAALGIPANSLLDAAHASGWLERYDKEGKLQVFVPISTPFTRRTTRLR